MDEKKMEGKIQYLEKPIYDSVHGFIKITQYEKEIINTMFFQRLREIKQLSFAQYVFPGAVHTRFSHSLGVLAVIQKLIDRVKETSEFITEKETKKLRMAALLHDIGHYPYSHMIEQAYKDVHKELIGMFEAEDEQGGVLSPYVISLKKEKPNLVDEMSEVDGHHESLGAYIIRKTNFESGITRILLNSGFTEEDIDDIAKIIQGKSLNGWYNQILHSELDADRLDYLLRDSYATGVHYGNFDYEYLIKNCRLVSEDGDVDNLIFTIKASAAFTVEHFLLARYFWYAQIIAERTISIFDLMGKEIYKWLINNKLAPNYIEVLDMVANPYSFFKFNDKLLWDILYGVIENDERYGNLKDYSFYRELSIMLLKRIPLKRVGIPIKKQLSLKEKSCNRKDVCPSVDKCLCFKGMLTLKDVEYGFSELVELAKRKLIEKNIDPLWVMHQSKNISISKLEGERRPDEIKRDPIRILEKDNTIKLLDSLQHSIVPYLSEHDLFVPRIYIKDEYEELIYEAINCG